MRRRKKDKKELDIEVETKTLNKIVRDTYDWQVKRPFVVRCSLNQYDFKRYDQPREPRLAKPVAQVRPPNTYSQF